jgi:hypothetical protein
MSNDFRFVGASVGDDSDAEWAGQLGFWRCANCGTDGSKALQAFNDAGEQVGEWTQCPSTVTHPDYPGFHGRAWCAECGGELERA